MAALPLQGIRIVDMTVVLAGPYAAMHLADLGAEVIKIESIQHFLPGTRGQSARPPQHILLDRSAGLPGGVPGPRPWNQVPGFNSMARNKLDITIDITKPEGMDIFKRLIRVSDVFLENFVPSVMDKLGITYEMLKREKPDIIFAKMSGYGDNGLYRDYRAFAMTVDPITGHSSLRGYRDEDPTTLTEGIYADSAMGILGVFAIVAALHYRNRTGKGQVLDLCLPEGAMTYLPQAMMDYTMNGRVRGTLGNRDPVAVPHGNFRCQGDDKWVSICVFNDDEWEGLSRVIGEEWTCDPKFKSVLGRKKHEDELERLLESWTSKHDYYEVMHLLQKEGVPAGAVVNDADIFHDPHLNERGYFVEVSQEDTGTHIYPGFMGKLSKTPCNVRRGPVMLGQDNEYVYKKILGVSDAEYKKLVKAGHIGTEYAPHIK